MTDFLHQILERKAACVRTAAIRTDEVLGFVPNREGFSAAEAAEGGLRADKSAIFRGGRLGEHRHLGQDAAAGHRHCF